MLRVCAANFKELLNGSCLELPSSVRREVEVEELDGKKWKRQCTRCWRCGSQVDRKATEHVYVGEKDTERVEDGSDSADMEEERGCA